MKYFFIGITLFGILTQAQECPYSAEPMNWILRYCGHEIQSDDEIAIQDSFCFKSAEKDLKAAADKCKTNEKYKSELCKKLLIKDKKYTSLKDCLKDSNVKPFFVGG